MFTDWIYWISSARPEDLLWMLLPLLLLDGIRYTASNVLMCLWDLVTDAARLWRCPQAWSQSDYLPNIAVLIVGLNEGDTIEHTLRSIYGTYPKMEILVVSDGSTDGMESRAQAFARHHRGVTVLHRPIRGGKSSAMNMALPFIRSEIVVVIDSDSHLDAHAIRHIVQPFRDPQVGAVSGCVSARNPFESLATYLQAFEYRRSIFVGRILLSRLGMLGIVSGALGAFRKSALDQVGGWDVGPGEDGDLTLKLRKAGYKINFVPAANCLTKVPRRWGALIRQRRRWEWAAITFECRKHSDLGNPFARHFTLGNFLLAVERWLFGFVLVYLGVFSMVAIACTLPPRQLAMTLATVYLAYVVCETLQFLILMYYSPTPRRELLLLPAIPLMPGYCALQKLVTFWAITEELFTRRSYRDNFVPWRVRTVTWHW